VSDTGGVLVVEAKIAHRQDRAIGISALLDDRHALHLVSDRDSYSIL
jgi:hypothetical protein